MESFFNTFLKQSIHIENAKGGLKRMLAISHTVGQHHHQYCMAYELQLRHTCTSFRFLTIPERFRGVQAFFFFYAAAGDRCRRDKKKNDTCI